MKNFTLEYLLYKKDFFKEKAKNENIFLYPTDTIYWIWSIPSKNTTNKIYNIKHREKNKPLSIIAPSTHWIKENFLVNKAFDENLKSYLDRYHGITILLKRKEEKFLDFLTTNEKIGVRIIKHPFQDFISYINQPFITTSANISGWKNPDKVENINSEVIENCDLVIDWWTLSNKASTIIDIENDYINER